MNLRIIPLGLLAALILMIGGASTRAQDYTTTPAMAISTVERVGFAYYALTGEDIPYYDWIQAMDVYKKASDAQRLDILSEEGERLALARHQAAGMLEPITLQWFFSMKQMAAPESHRGVSLTIPNQSIAYIPVQVGRKWIAMIPGEMRIPELHMIDVDVFERLQKDYGVNPGNPVPVVAEISLRPVQADKGGAVKIDGMDLWLMMTEVESLSIIGSDMEPIWVVPQKR